MVTWRSSIASRRADCVRGGVRLISSTRSRSVKMGPRCKVNELLERLKTLAPRMSAGIRSGVHCTRWNFSRKICASTFTASVFASPGTPSTSACPPTSRTRKSCSSASRWPTITFSIWHRTCVANSFAVLIPFASRFFRTTRFQARYIVEKFLSQGKGFAIVELEACGGLLRRHEGFTQSFFLPTQLLARAARQFRGGEVDGKPEPAGQQKPQALKHDLNRGGPRMRGRIQISERLDKFERRESRNLCRHSNRPISPGICGHNRQESQSHLQHAPRKRRLLKIGP